MKRLLVLRPEPGLSASAAKATAMGLEVVAHPLFAVEPVAASLPEGEFDAVVVTSANAARHAGILLDLARHLPTYAVGKATANALRERGIEPVATGRGGVEGLTLPEGRLLHLCGIEHRPLSGDVVVVPVYRTHPTPAPLPDLAGAVVAVHSPAAGRRLNVVADAARATASIAAISPNAAAACGEGWLRVETATVPDDETLLALAATLCQSRHR